MASISGWKSLAAAVAWLLIVQGAAQATEKPILAVMPVEVRTESLKLELRDLEGATDYMRALLVKTGRFVVVDKGRMESGKQRVLTTLKRESHSECYDEKCRIELGRALAADTVLTCTVSGFGSACTLNCELTALASEATSEAAVAEFPCLVEQFQKALKHAVGQFAGSEMPAEEVEEPEEETAPPGTGLVNRALRLFFPKHRTGVVRVSAFSTPGWNLGDQLLGSGRLVGAYVFKNGIRVEGGFRHLGSFITEPADDWDLTADLMLGYDHRYFEAGLGLGFHRIEPEDEMQDWALTPKIRLGCEEGLNATFRSLLLLRTDNLWVGQLAARSQLPVHERVYLYGEILLDFVTQDFEDTSGHAIGGLKFVLSKGGKPVGRLELSLGTGVSWTLRTEYADEWEETGNETLWAGQLGVDWRY